MLEQKGSSFRANRIRLNFKIFKEGRGVRGRTADVPSRPAADADGVCLPWPYLLAAAIRGGPARVPRGRDGSARAPLRGHGLWPMGGHVKGGYDVPLPSPITDQ
ncbi:hypothetical protein [Stenotrophomonas sp. MMGLT7]|uniref:hypothetical protein n=1 Tax=Stenotrophomonas sp. MMGLT7 TaxID=2901227 RepID=UPI001E3A78AA|nr:hypothetical protein [Stenotrophomonas sp. MMGLT7]